MADQGTEGLLSPYLRYRRCAAAKPYFSGEILDLGCGTGSLAKYISPNSYLGVDIDPLSLEMARSRHPEHEFQSELPSIEQKFDTVLALAVIEHVVNPEEFLVTCSKHLNAASSARIVITTPHPSFEKFHYFGSLVGVFSRHANEEHQELLDYQGLVSVSNSAGLALVHYKRFLFGGNQLAIFQKPNKTS